MPILPQEKCKKKHSDQVEIAVTIDDKGMPHEAYLLRATGTGVDEFAVRFVEADRFDPARQSGLPIAVKRKIDLEIETCTGKLKDSNGQTKERTWLNSLPRQTVSLLPSDAASPVIPTEVYKVGGHVSPPIPIVTPEAHYTDEARKSKLEGKCLVTVIVDASGIPRNAQVIRLLGQGLDDSAIQAVMRYRFKPALKDGSRPVPVRITIEVNFRLR